MKPILTAALLAATTTWAACGTGNPTSPSRLPGSIAGLTTQHTVTGGTGTTTNGSSDSSTLSYLANLHYGFVQLGYLAESRGDHARVKAFGLQLVQEHGIGQDKVATLGGESMMRAGTFDSATRAVYDELRGVSGSEFDRLFIPNVMTLLNNALTRVNSIDNSASTRALQTYGSDLAETISDHLRMLRDLDTIV